MAQASGSASQRRRKTTSRRKADGTTAGGTKGRRWSAEVNKRSNALDLERSVFRSSDPHRVALSLKRSAERSKRRKASPYQSALSMLNFSINRAGKGLPRRQVRVLEQAKGKLRKAFGRA